MTEYVIKIQIPSTWYEFVQPVIDQPWWLLVIWYPIALPVIAALAKRDKDFSRDVGAYVFLWGISPLVAVLVALAAPFFLVYIVFARVAEVAELRKRDETRQLVQSGALPVRAQVRLLDSLDYYDQSVVSAKLLGYFSADNEAFAPADKLQHVEVGREADAELRECSYRHGQILTVEFDDVRGLYVPAPEPQRKPAPQPQIASYGRVDACVTRPADAGAFFGTG